MSDATDMTPEEVVTEIGMSDLKSRAAILLVEGATDAALYRSLFNETSAPTILIQATGSRKNLEGVLTIVNSNDPTVQSFPKAIAIADRDYTQALGLPTPQGTVFFTDARDIECMMIMKPPRNPDPGGSREFPATESLHEEIAIHRQPDRGGAQGG